MERQETPITESRHLSFFERAVTEDPRSVRRQSWRRHPRKMIRRALRRPKPLPAPPTSRPASVDEVLQRLAGLDLGYWSYGWEPAEVRHFGPMAQDFWAAFGLGSSDRVIPTVDAQGLLMGSVQALLDRIAHLEARVAELEAGHLTTHEPDLAAGD